MYDNQSPEYFVKHWRNIPQEKLETLEEFMAWYEFEFLADPYANKRQQRAIKAKVAEMQRTIDEFLEINPIKAKQGELKLLEGWIKATTQEG